MLTKGTDMYSKLRQFLENRFLNQTKYTYLRTLKKYFLYALPFKMLHA